MKRIFNRFVEISSFILIYACTNKYYDYLFKLMNMNNIKILIFCLLAFVFFFIWLLMYINVYSCIQIATSIRFVTGINAHGKNNGRKIFRS